MNAYFNSIYTYTHIYIYIYMSVKTGIHSLGSRRSLTTPVEARPLPAQEPETYQRHLVGLLRRKGRCSLAQSESECALEGMSNSSSLIRETKSHKHSLPSCGNFELMVAFRVPQDRPLGSRIEFPTL